MFHICVVYDTQHICLSMDNFYALRADKVLQCKDYTTNSFEKCGHGYLCTKLSRIAMYEDRIREQPFYTGDL